MRLQSFGFSMALALLPALLPVLAGDAGSTAPLRFDITDGRIQNAFYQQGDIAAHLLLSSGDKPRLLVAFPAGNSGVGVWFEPASAPVQWKLGKLDGLRRTVDGHAWNGIVAEASVSSATPLVVKDAVLSSIRVLRDYQTGQIYPEQVAATPQLTDRTVRWQRQRLDGAPGYALALSTDNGHVAREHGHIVLRPDRAGEPLHLRIEASTGEPPLTPFAHLFNDQVQPDPRSQQVLRFLSYHQKFLAGSWRFDTYFGRDTLMSLRMLMPVLQPAAVDDGIASVLMRLAPDGEVAHEEGIGEFAVLDHLEKQGKLSDAPVYDYQMIDGDYMLAPVAAAWLLDDARGRAGARAFLAKGDGGATQGAALVRNLLFVAKRSEAFARQPVFSNLINLKPGNQVGQWRDSNTGLGGGRYPYDVNVVWVPAALRAIGRFLDAGLLDAYTTGAQRAQLRADAARADAWERDAAAMFTVRLDHAKAAEQVQAYAARVGVPAAAALASLPKDGVRFPAIALDAQGRPVAILHSDEGFDLLFGQPDAATLDRYVSDMLRPFPAGLMTGVGMVVANPVYADRAMWPIFGSNMYHGTVVWSWQQALLADGLRRQLARSDLPQSTRTLLARAQATLWRGICATQSVRDSELWSWTYADGGYHVEPFGAVSSNADESNAAQLWSTVYLAIPPPKGDGLSCH